MHYLNSRILKKLKCEFSHFTAELANHFYVQTEDISPREFSAANVTCVAFDSSGVKVPEKIKFMRRDNFGGGYYELTASDNLYFTNRSENYGRWTTSKQLRLLSFLV